jgi:hypothetical protein
MGQLLTGQKSGSKLPKFILRNQSWIGILLFQKRKRDPNATPMGDKQAILRSKGMGYR